jgi:hypothetical protein
MFSHVDKTEEENILEKIFKTNKNNNYHKLSDNIFNKSNIRAFKVRF